MLPAAKKRLALQLQPQSSSQHLARWNEDCLGQAALLPGRCSASASHCHTCYKAVIGPWVELARHAVSLQAIKRSENDQAARHFSGLCLSTRPSGALGQVLCSVLLKPTRGSSGCACPRESAGKKRYLQQHPAAQGVSSKAAPKTVTVLHVMVEVLLVQQRSASWPQTRASGTEHSLSGSGEPTEVGKQECVPSAGWSDEEQQLCPSSRICPAIRGSRTAQKGPCNPNPACSRLATTRTVGRVYDLASSRGRALAVELLPIPLPNL